MKASLLTESGVDKSWDTHQAEREGLTQGLQLSSGKPIWAYLCTPGTHKGRLPWTLRRFKLTRIYLVKMSMTCLISMEEKALTPEPNDCVISNSKEPQLPLKGCTSWYQAHYWSLLVTSFSPHLLWKGPEHNMAPFTLHSAVWPCMKPLPSYAASKLAFIFG